MNRETFDEYEQRKRREIRRFYKTHPWTFREIIAEFEVWAKSKQNRRGAPSIPLLAYASILSDWLNAKEDGIRTQRAFAARCDPKGWKWADRSRRSTWRGYDAIRKAIQKAQRKARTDPAFAQEVKDFRFARRFLKEP